MAIKRPDIYEHNNPDLSIVDSDNVRGATKYVADQAAMLALPIDKLKLYSRVRYYDGGNEVEYRLINISDPSNILNWELIVASGVTNLGYTVSPTQGTITSNTGTDAIIPVVDSTNAGLMSPSQSDKLTNIEVGATSDQIAFEVPFTPVGNTSSLNVQDAIEELQTDIDNFLGNTDLSYISSPTGGIITSSTGTDANLILSNSVNAGLMSPSQNDNLANQSGVNTGDETQSSIQIKRPLKTIEGQTIEGTGNIDLSSIDVGLGNVPNVDATNRANHTGTQTASTISNFDTEVSNNTDVAANTSKLSTIESNAKDDQIANEVPVTPTGNLLSTNVQAGLEELQTKLDNFTPYTFTGNTVPMDKPTTAYNTLVNNTFTLYTLSATVVVGAKAIIRIQTPTTEPNVQLDGGGAVDKKLEGDVWVANTEMNLTIENQGGRIVYYFIRN